jgi:hypothetical protein
MMQGPGKNNAGTKAPNHNNDGYLQTGLSLKFMESLILGDGDT